MRSFIRSQIPDNWIKNELRTGIKLRSVHSTSYAKEWNRGQGFGYCAFQFENGDVRRWNAIRQRPVTWLCPTPESEGQVWKARTFSSENFHKSEEGHGDDQIEEPIGRCCNAVASATCPQRINLGVDCPRHRSHSFNFISINLLLQFFPEL